MDYHSTPSKCQPQLNVHMHGLLEINWSGDVARMWYHIPDDSTVKRSNSLTYISCHLTCTVLLIQNNSLLFMVEIAYGKDLILARLGVWGVHIFFQILDHLYSTVLDYLYYCLYPKYKVVMYSHLIEAFKVHHHYNFTNGLSTNLALCNILVDHKSELSILITSILS